MLSTASAAVMLRPRIGRIFELEGVAEEGGLLEVFLADGLALFVLEYGNSALEFGESLWNLQVLDMGAAAGLVHYVNCLVWQASVRYVPLAERYAAL